MRQTLHYKLKKPQRLIPQEDDAANIDDLNFNSDSIDSILYTQQSEDERLEKDKADKTTMQKAFDLVNDEITLKADNITVNAAFAAVNASVAEKADILAVLTKTNDEIYSPTSNYQPATKKYVDDSMAGSGSGDMLKSVYDKNDDGVVDVAKAIKGGEW